MAKIPKTKVYNPQKAEAYVGKGVLRTGGKITPVPNGHLIKKNGDALKNGGKVSAAWQRKEGKKPTAQMLKQEKKIKSQTKKK